MARTAKGSPPSYSRHSSGKACVTVREAVTNRRRVLLLGPFGSPESKEEYRRVLAVLEANRGGVNADPEVQRLPAKRCSAGCDLPHSGRPRRAGPNLRR